jgi:hypothetical protein
VSTLQKYFSGFTVKILEGDDEIKDERSSSSLTAQKSYQVLEKKNSKHCIPD